MSILDANNKPLKADDRVRIVGRFHGLCGRVGLVGLVRQAQGDEQPARIYVYNDRDEWATWIDATDVVKVPSPVCV